MKCANCGENLKKGTNFCPNCGTRVEDESVEKIVETVVEETVKTEGKVAETSTNNNANKPVAKKNNKMGLAGFIVALCGLCCWSFACSIVGLVLSAVAKKNIDPQTQKNKGFAIAGLVIGIVALVFICIKRVISWRCHNWLIW